MSQCPLKWDFCLVRGDTLLKHFAFEGAWVEGVEKDLSLYDFKMVFREQQADWESPLLEIIGTKEVFTDDCGEAEPDKVLVAFTATPAQTSALPEYDIFHYIELKQVSDGAITTAVNGGVEIRD